MKPSPRERGPLSNFLRESSGRGGQMWAHSVARSILALRGDVNLSALRHEHDKGTLRCWWGPLLEVNRGDVVRYFTSPAGVAVEWVERKESWPA